MKAKRITDKDIEQRGITEIPHKGSRQNNWEIFFPTLLGNLDMYANFNKFSGDDKFIHWNQDNSIKP